MKKILALGLVLFSSIAFSATPRLYTITVKITPADAYINLWQDKPYKEFGQKKGPVAVFKVPAGKYNLDGFRDDLGNYGYKITVSKDQTFAVDAKKDSQGGAISIGPTFKSCAEARAAGYSRMKVGEPGYSSDLDRDADGIACE